VWLLIGLLFIAAGITLKMSFKSKSKQNSRLAKTDLSLPTITSIATTLIAIVVLVFTFAAAMSSTDILIIVSVLLALSFVICSRHRHILHTVWTRKWGILFGCLLFFVFVMVPDPNSYANAPWPHKLFHVYCNGALLWVYVDKAEKSCHPGPESEYFMNHLQMLARYPIYATVLDLAILFYAPIMATTAFYLITRKYFSGTE
jgi:hypothetical protein